jgi:lipoprotein NlpD
MPQTLSRCCNRMLMLLAAAVLAACSASPRAPAPVEDRNHGVRPLSPSVAVQPVRPPGAAVSQEIPAGPRIGYYTVKPGDTLIRIALEAGQNWRDVVRWNNMENPNVIEVGQVLRVTPPVTPGAAEVAAVRPLPPASSTSIPVPAAGEARAPLAPAPGLPAASARSDGNEDEVPWGWPTAGAPTVLAGFDEARNKGLDIGGKAGDPVLASADGRVVYAGAGLRGYGNLIILKHNNTYLTAYAHNQALLVKEDQTVRKGQKIAEMGNSDADRVKLHFEIRRQGKPVDPTKYLPR